MKWNTDRVVAKPVTIDDSASGGKKRELYAEVCYFYPQYTLKEVAQLPARDVKLLLKVARRQEALRNFNLVQIVASPHTKKGMGVKKLSDYFKKEFEQR